MNYLVDTNVFIEIFLERERAEDARNFLQKTKNSETYITDFSLHSIGIILFRLERKEAFSQFLNDLIFGAGMRILHLEPDELDKLLEISEKYNLDFDNAYQYAVAEKFGSQIISFDSDFNRTDKGRKAPEELNANL